MMIHALPGFDKNTRLKMYSQSTYSNVITKLLSIQFQNSHFNSMNQARGEFVNMSFNGKKGVKGITVGVTFHDEELLRLRILRTVRIFIITASKTHKVPTRRRRMN